MQTNTSTLTHIADFDYYSHNVKVISLHAQMLSNSKQIKKDFYSEFEDTLEKDNKIPSFIYKQYSKFIYPSFLKKNLSYLKKYLNFTQAECDVFAFFYYANKGRFALHQGYSTALGKKIIEKIFNHTSKDVNKALSDDSMLFKLDVLCYYDSDAFGIDVNNFESIFTQDISKTTLMGEFSYFLPKTRLNLSDFDYIQEELNTIITFLKKRQKGNIFIYGKAGVGKNELSALIAKELGKEALCVKDCENDKKSSRISNFYALKKILNPKKQMIVFDECEDSLCYDSLKEKLKINKILDEENGICVFLSNSKDMDEAYLRRFDVILELESMPKEKKIQNIKKLFNKKNIKIDEVIIENIASHPELSQGVILKCANNAKIFKSKSQEVFVRLINENLKARSLQGISIPKKDKKYDLSLIECDLNLQELINNIDKNSSLRILSYGIAGSGKSEFGKELANVLNKTLHSYKLSDILDPFVGNNEKNIANIFKKASNDNAILQLDEIDALIYSRDEANKSWEKSLVNEMLMQMENFEGIFIASTNYLQNLDKASIRRFDLKIEFQALKQEKLLKAFDFFAKELNLSFDKKQISKRLLRLQNICLGDFALILRQNKIFIIKNADEFLEKLEKESKLKSDDEKINMGFL
ncbi:AAA family ATPase [Campylobacter sp. RKI_CA19_01116]|uniref:AAA family ATPase n=1 Tax=Campylobacter sp. RKI_CA19_01116 TaxID=2911625 RepID=UPI0021E86D94|nr:AAA family ATPase [Campylobacter sp. RKI_CA19_01116]MCV3396692.1 AAA family ATPase [Campylobacter sp. RKI_CA19_01116]